MNKQELMEFLIDTELTEEQEIAVFNCSEVLEPNFKEVLSGEAFAITKSGEFLARINGFLTLGKKIISIMKAKEFFDKDEIVCIAK